MGFTSHYERMRARYGNHLADGIAGENILVDAGVVIDEAALAAGVVILTASGPVPLANVHAAAPCVEFSRFCAGYGRERQSDRHITETLQFLDGGIRGFYATLAADAAPVTIAPGDILCRLAVPLP
jgi:hypothetical protein